MRLQAAVVADTLRRNGEVVVPMDVPGDAVGDVDDLPVLGTAVAGRADCLITGDKQLLELSDYQGILILSPRQFYEGLRACD